MKFHWAALLILGFLSLDSVAQSLPEVARSERARRGERTVGRVFTNENVQSARTGIQVSRPTTPPPVPLAPNDREEAAGEPTEQEWRQDFSDARAEVTRLESQLELAQSELDALNFRLLTESSLYNRENVLQPEIDAKTEELARTGRLLQQANQTIQDLQGELRRSGAPAAWGRR